MLKLYNKLVYDYINDEDIDNIDELENNYKFMMEVIQVSKDKKMYNLCSDNVKYNYEFVKFMINTFKNDKDFVHEIASLYFEKVGSSDITAKELYFIMRGIFNDYSDDRCLTYNLKCFSMYENDRELINSCIRYEHESIGRNDLGLGFAYVIDYYAGISDIITEYYAKRFLDEIFYDDGNKKIEEFIHSRIRDVNDIKIIGIKKFILDIVRDYDVFLHDYLFAHINLISNIEKDVVKIINNWDRFNIEMIERKKCIFEQEVDILIEKYNVNFDYNDICFYIDNNLNLSVKLSIIEDNEIYGINFNKISLNEYECFKKIIKLAKDLFNNPVIDANYNFKDDEQKVVPRILKFKNKNFSN